MSSCGWVSSRTGVSVLKPCFLAAASRIRKYQALVVLRDQGRTAPSASERFLLGITSSGSISIFTPRPVQSGQAPWGLLKLKLRSEEHTSELQSRGHLVCRLLLEKKKNNT